MLGAVLLAAGGSTRSSRNSRRWKCFSDALFVSDLQKRQIGRSRYAAAGKRGRLAASRSLCSRPELLRRPLPAGNDGLRTSAPTPERGQRAGDFRLRLGSSCGGDRGACLTPRNFAEGHENIEGQPGEGLTPKKSARRPPRQCLDSARTDDLAVRVAHPLGDACVGGQLGIAMANTALSSWPA